MPLPCRSHRHHLARWRQDARPTPADLHTEEEVAVFAATHLGTAATVVSDGLGCFRATAFVGAGYERIVTGGGKASVFDNQRRWIPACAGMTKCKDPPSLASRSVKRF